MANLSNESKLITPGGALFLVALGGAFSIWYFDIDVWEHLQGVRETIHYVTNGVF